MKLEERNGRIYATARAYILDDGAPRELASAFSERSNPAFLYIAGRYVQANKANRNGQFWSFEDLEAGQGTIKNTPLNINHDFHQPIGVITDAKMVNMASADGTESLPEIQALSVVWRANFPNQAELVKMAHNAGKLHYSMECVAEKTQCLTCDESFAYASRETCDHLKNTPNAPRRFVNPTFLGGALIVPPKSPGWADADITELAHEFAMNSLDGDHEVEKWQSLMHMAMDGFS